MIFQALDLLAEQFGKDVPQISVATEELDTASHISEAEEVLMEITQEREGTEGVLQVLEDSVVDTGLVG